VRCGDCSRETRPGLRYCQSCADGYKRYQLRNADRERERRQRRYKRQRHVEIARKQVWRQVNRDRVNAHQRDYRRRRRSVYAASELRVHFGLSVEQFEQLAGSYGHRCAICGGDNRHKRLCVDHAHDKLGLNRGVLCMVCNKGLGLFYDSATSLLRAVDYLRSPPGYVLRARWHYTPLFPMKHPLGFEQLFAACGMRCAVCWKPRNDDRRRWTVDHDARTGLVRGVLCLSCNSGLGAFREQPDLFRGAASYVRYWRALHDLAKKNGLPRARAERAALVLELHR